MASLTTLRSLVVAAVAKAASTQNNSAILDHFQVLLDDYTTQLSGPGLHQLTDLTQITTKAKGDLFELLCGCYLQHFSDCDQVYPQAQLPSQLRSYLGLGNSIKDMGIDLVAHHQPSNGWWAIQCKYRKRPRRKTVLSPQGYPIRVDQVAWQDLATFYALCERTGPAGGWSKRVVMTTASGINRVGGRLSHDRSICAGTWRSLTSQQWYQLVGITGRTLTDGDNYQATSGQTKLAVESISPEQIRQLRLARFSNGSSTV